MIITSFYAGLLGFLFLLLSVRVIMRRVSSATSLGYGDDVLRRRVRGHGNFSEYVPLILLMMALLELGRTSTYVLHALGIGLLCSRLLHGYALGFTRNFVFGRTAGAALTLLVLIVASVLCVMQGLRGLPLL